MTVIDMIRTGIIPCADCFLEYKLNCALTLAFFR